MDKKLTLEDILNLPPDRAEKPLERNEESYGNYMEALEVLESMRRQGKLNYTYDDPEDNFTLHCVTVDWVTDERSQLLELSAREIENVLKYFDDVVIDTSKGNGSWQFSSTLYVETNVVSIL